MTPKELEQLQGFDSPRDAEIGVVFGPDRTLLFGYDTDRRTWHVYQQGGLLHHVIYSYGSSAFDFTSVAERLTAVSLVPNKRLYPERCDFLFCARLRQLGVGLPFTTYPNSSFENRQFYGRTL